MENVFEASLQPESQAIIAKTYDILRQSAGLHITESYITQLLEGAYDTHIHAGPDSFACRPVSEADVAKMACDYGMGGVVFKLQSAIGAARQQFVQEIADRYADEHGKKRVEVYSGVVLNKPVGGINPYAVEASLEMGGKYVWTPSRDAAHHKRAEGRTDAGVEVCTPDGSKLVPEMYEILEMIAKKDAILGISHQSTRERFMLVKAAKEAGVQRIVIEHPQNDVTKTTIEQMREFRKMGAYLGMCYVCAVPNFVNPYVDETEIRDIIRALGTDHLVAQTDMTQVQTPDPVCALRLFAKSLLSLKITEDEVRRIFVDNCYELLH